MTSRRIAWTILIVVPALLIALVAVGYWTPPAHGVQTVGATPLSWRSVGADFRWAGAPPPPTTDLGDLRCTAWRTALRQPCPDDITLARRLWSGLAGAPHRLYVPYVGGGYGLPWPSGSNLEYLSTKRTVVIHDYESRPLLFGPSHPDQSVGTAPYATLSVRVIDITGIPPGRLKVVEDSWIERITGDEANGAQALGSVEIP